MYQVKALNRTNLDKNANSSFVISESYASYFHIRGVSWNIFYKKKITILSLLISQVTSMSTMLASEAPPSKWYGQIVIIYAQFLNVSGGL